MANDKMYRHHYDLMARKYRNRAGDAQFIDALKLRMNNDYVGEQLAQSVHDTIWKLIRHLEQKAGV